MDLKLIGKRAFITGASAGIGASIAEHLAAEGASVIIHGRNIERTQEVARRINEKGGQAKIALGDLATEEGAVAAADAALAAWGGIDILVNNAGGTSKANGSWTTITAADWQRTYDLNIFSTLRMVQLCLPNMRGNGWGRIIQIGTMASRRGGPTIADYSSLKASLPVMTVSLAKELAGTGITVNCVAPGYVVTNVLREHYLNVPENRGKSWEEIEPAAALSSGSLIGRLGTPEDIATLVAFLSSPLSEFINGSNILIDGGMLGTV